MSRRKAREYALKTLYLMDSAGVEPKQAMQSMKDLEDQYDEQEIFLRRLVLGTYENVHAIDGVITSYAIGWSLSRMAIVDRALLRLAIYEMLYLEDIPASVSINEAVELANKYSTVDSGKFINGILGKIARDNLLEADSCQN